MVGTILMLLGTSIILYCSWVALRPAELKDASLTNLKRTRGGPKALVDRFPGPVNIGVSIPKYLVLFAISCAFFAGAVAIIRSPETFAADSHGRFRGEGLLHLLVFSHIARDRSQALAQVGWIAAALFGLGAFAIIFKLILSVTGSWGLTLDEEGFTVIALKGNKRHRWLDVGDFDSLAASKIFRRYGIPFSKSCLVFNDYRAPDSPIKWLRLTGRNRALMEAYEYSGEDLALAMSAWRKQALENRLGQNG
jgi:hypothetical protein